MLWFPSRVADPGSHLGPVTTSQRRRFKSLVNMYWAHIKTKVLRHLSVALETSVQVILGSGGSLDRTGLFWAFKVGSLTIDMNFERVLEMDKSCVMCEGLMYYTALRPCSH